MIVLVCETNQKAKIDEQIWCFVEPPLDSCDDNQKAKVEEQIWC